MSNGISLVDRHTDATQCLILESAVVLLERHGVKDLTVRAVARHAGMSERTVFRYFATRDDFLDAVASEVQAQLETPSPPGTIDALPSYPGLLYPCFEAKADLVKAALHTELFERLREAVGDYRWREVGALVAACGVHRTPRDQRIAATNICYYLTATTWHYYRFYFGLSLKDTVAAARQAIEREIQGIRPVVTRNLAS